MTKVNPNKGNETQDQKFEHVAYSNLALYLFLSKNMEVFQCLSKSKYLSFMTTVNQSNGNATKSDIFKSDVIFN